MDILLFDIDGVLVNPLGYRACVKKTLDYFYKKMDLLDKMPPEDIAVSFEAIGITSEWDMIPICLAIVFDTFISNYKDGDIVLKNFEEGYRFIKNSEKSNVKIDYSRFLDTISNNILKGNSAPGTFLMDILTGKYDNPFQYFSGQPLLFDLFSTTRDIEKSLTLQVFQNFALGSEKFEEIYKQDALFSSASYLHDYDQPLLAKEQLHKICKLLNDDKIKAAIYTARPSSYPREVEFEGIGYSPEAEIAIGLNKINNIPLIGLGKITYMAKMRGINPEELIKPSPFQSLACVFAAILNNELMGLKLADEVLFNRTKGNNYLKNILNSILDHISYNEDINIHIFEDSISGMAAGEKSLSYLRDCGLESKLHTWGISMEKPKIDKLENSGYRVFSNVNQALEVLFDRINS